VGEDEQAAGQVTMRPLGGGEQVRVERGDVVNVVSDWVKGLL
jgi:hypothetical protein